MVCYRLLQHFILALTSGAQHSSGCANTGVGTSPPPAISSDGSATSLWNTSASCRVISLSNVVLPVSQKSFRSLLLHQLVSNLMPMSAATLTTDGVQQQNHRGSVVSNTQDMWTEVMWCFKVHMIMVFGLRRHHTDGYMLTLTCTRPGGSEEQR